MSEIDADIHSSVPGYWQQTKRPSIWSAWKQGAQWERNRAKKEGGWISVKESPSTNRRLVKCPLSSMHCAITMSGCCIRKAYIAPYTLSWSVVATFTLSVGVTIGLLHCTPIHALLISMINEARTTMRHVTHQTIPKLFLKRNLFIILLF